MYQFLIIAYRFTFQDKKSKLDALQNFLGAVNNQVLIRKYEIIGTDFRTYIVGEEGRALYNKYPLLDDTNDYKFINIFMLKEYFFIY